MRRYDNPSCVPQILTFPQVIVANLLRDVSKKKSDIIHELDDIVNYGERVIQGEINELNEMANKRIGRQKLVLLKKASIMVLLL